MIYLMSDIHGNFSRFKRALATIEFSKDKDVLYILGDIFDRGTEAFAILEFIRPYIEQGSMVLIKGNHELFVQQYIEGTMPELRLSAFGGDDTIEHLSTMGKLERNELKQFLRLLPWYVELDTQLHGRTILTHTGVDNRYLVNNEDGTINVVESIKAAAMANEYDYLITDSMHAMPFNELGLLDCYVYCGHVPVQHLHGEDNYAIYETDRYTCIDSGLQTCGGKLACVCVDTGKVWYI